MNRAALVISLIAVFVIGCAAGLAGGIVFARHLHGMRGGFAGRMAPSEHRPFGPRDAMPRLQRLLELTPDQVRRIEPKVIESQQQFEAARESLHSRIDAELTPAQRERWRQFQRRHPFPGPPPGAEGRTHRAPPGQEGEPR